MIILLPVDFVIIHEGKREYLSIATSKYMPDPFYQFAVGLRNLVAIPQFFKGFLLLRLGL